MNLLRPAFVTFSAKALTLISAQLVRHPVLPIYFKGNQRNPGSPV